MSKSVITVTHPDGTKNVLVGKSSNSKPIKSASEPIKTRKITLDDKEEDETKRAKPVLIKAGLTKERNPYKYGGKAKCK